MFNHFNSFKILLRFNSSSSSSNLNIEKLVNIFKQYDFPDYYDYMVKQNPVVKNLKRASLLVPITFEEKIDSNDDNLRQDTFFTFSKRTQNMRHYSDQVKFIQKFKI
jgi:hypothetical protein